MTDSEAKVGAAADKTAEGTSHEYTAPFSEKPLETIFLLPLTGWRRDVRTAISFVILLCFAFSTVLSVCCTWGAANPKANEKGITTSIIMFVGGAAMVVWLTVTNQIEVSVRLEGWRRDVRATISLVILLCFAFSTIVSVCCTWGAADPGANQKGMATSVSMFVGGGAMIAWLTVTNKIDRSC